MKSYTMYVCETCGKESKNRKTIQCCEAGHLGLTWLEYLDYRDLKARVKMYEIHLDQAIRDKVQWRIDSSRKSLENSKKAVADFEDAHGIKNILIGRN